MTGVGWIHRATVATLVAAALFASGPVAVAHAFLDHADPKVGSELRSAPRQLRLWFTQPLAAAFSRVTVSGPPGFAGAGPSRAAPGDPRCLIVDLTGPTPPGRYQVRWRVLSVDTHTTEGDFTFNVRP